MFWVIVEMIGLEAANFFNNNCEFYGERGTIFIAHYAMFYRTFQCPTFTVKFAVIFIEKFAVIFIEKFWEFTKTC